MTFVVIFILVALDRAFKVFASAYLTAGKTVTLIPGIIGLELLGGGNTGAAFGIFKGKVMYLACMSLVCVVVLLWLLRFKKFSSPVAKWSFVLICAGAMGNLYDRFFYGVVTDYIVFLFMEFPVFNFADCLVDIGAALFIIYTLFLQKDEPLFVKAAAADELPAEEEGSADEQ